jgi:hypothetical protein
MPAALDLLERGASRAARALQAGPRPADQCEAQRLAKTTLRRIWRRWRVVMRLAEMTEQLGSLALE